MLHRIARYTAWTCLCCIAAPALVQPRVSAQEGGVLPNVYDYPAHETDARYHLIEAMNAAGEAVPAEVQSYYFLVLDGSIMSGDDVDELVRLMRLAHAEGDYLGVIGSKAIRNLRVLHAAMARTRPGELQGLQLIFVGPEDHAHRAAEAVSGSGATLHFRVYPPASDKAREATPSTPRLGT
jgi:hypothetical protein